MRLLVVTVIIGSLGCMHPGPRQSYGNHSAADAPSFGQVLKGISAGMEVDQSGRESATVYQATPAVTKMKVTDWACMSDCQKAHYKQATCDNMCTSD